MRKKRERLPVVDVVAYISTTGSVWEVEQKEKVQEKYLKDYAKKHNLYIAGIIYRSGLGQVHANNQFDQITKFIHLGRLKD